ncbi:MFS transporter [Candidatus Comchoanobacter bicostacola]|uniref:Lysosomal dipeptide transporter MFSD1 n=1 Tax=Candidatus Comchoanobacter bicostacola TaxID=2919598 RepID=A0ABY5DK08_9GAMM|nr:MFS transporter [Candidatus Comchoanobacter bicostacola]UTC24145.1 MFS transporter [Candidatus Comchoanobacter bicostacola]
MSSNSKTPSLFITLMAWLTCSLFYGYSSSVISAITTASSDMQETLSISKFDFGIITSTFLLSYALMHIPVGIILDHYSVRKSMYYAIGGFTLGCAVISVSQSYHLVLFSRLMMGICSAFGVLGAFKVATDFLPRNLFATLAGLTVSAGMLGAILGTSFITKLNGLGSYQQAFSYYTYFGALLTLSAFIFIKDSPKRKSSPSLNNISQEIQSVLCNKMSMQIILYAMILYTPYLMLKDTYGIEFFEQYYNTTKEQASEYMNLILIASVFAAPSLGIISDYLGKRLPLLKITGVLLFFLSAIIFTKTIPAYLSINVFLFGFCSWGFLIAFSIFKETHSEHIVSTGLGVMNSINMLGGIILAPLFGKALETIPNLFEVTEMQAWKITFCILPLLILCALPMLRSIPETHCKQVRT